MSESLGRAILELEANLAPFEKNMQAGKHSAGGMQDALDALASVANIAERELNRVKMSAGQADESKASASAILEGVKGVSEEARTAARELDHVKLGNAQSAETTINADRIERKMDSISRKAGEARRSLEGVKLAGVGGAGGGILGGILGGGASGGGGGIGMPGLMPAAIGAGALLAPAAGPGALGLLASIPVVASSAAGAAGVLALAFQGVGKAIGGDKKAFEGLQQSQQQFVLMVRSLDGELDKLKQTAGNALFPGLTAGLKAALSPGTLGAITTAIKEFGGAIGAAGEQWGRYFGSAEFQTIFGPMMASGAHNLTLMSTAALHLFDAIGVLGRAAIPFTTWMTQAIANGSRLADAWMHSKDASGALGRALDEARTSLKLVADLVVALGRAVGALGAALYPISKIAVKDLTDGLNGLAGIIERNKNGIRDFVGGALAGLVATVRVAVPLVERFAGVLGDVAHAVGGWKVAFEILLSGLLVARIAGVVGALAQMTVGVEALGLAIGGLPLAGIVIPIVLDITYRKQISDAISSAADWVIKGLGGNTDPAGAPTYQQWQKSKGSARLAIESAMRAHGYNDPSQLPGGPGSLPAGGAGSDAAAKAAHGVGMARDAADIFFGKSTAGESSTLISALEGLSQHYGGAKIDVLSGYRSTAAQQALWDASVKAGHPGRMPNGNPIARPGTSPHESGSALDGQIMINGKLVPLSSLPQSVLAQYGLSTVAGDVNHVQLASISGTDTSSPFGTVPPWSKNLGPKPPKPPVIPNDITALLNEASANKSKAKQLGDIGGTAKRYLENELADLTAADDKLKGLTPKTERDKAHVAAKITETENKIRDVNTKIKDAMFATGDALLPDLLKTRLIAAKTKFKADSQYAQSLTGDAAVEFQKSVLRDVTVQTAILTQETGVLKAKLADATGKHKTAIQKELKKVSDQLRAAQEQVVQTLQGTVSAIQGQVGTAFQSVAGELATAFEAKTQQLVDELGVKFFQNGALTPYEQQLADLNRQHTKEQLQQALDDATKAYNDALNASLVYDASTGMTTSNVNYPALKDAQRQLKAAQDAIAQDDLQVKATAERTAADKQYAESVKLLQATRAQTEADMNRDLAKLGDAFQNGTGSISDLKRIADEYGIQITDTTIPDFDLLSRTTSSLIQAFGDLASYIAKITGTAVRVPAGTTVTAGGWRGKVDANQVPISAGFAGFDEHGNWVGGDISSIKIPKLDTGGTVMKTGLAVVHRGETYSGVGASRLAGGLEVHIHAGTVIGGDLRLLADQLSGHMRDAIRRRP